MDSTAQESYLEAQVLTATPQKLRLMLIEGAIASARQSLFQWDAGNQEEAWHWIVRCRDIVAELMAGVESNHSDLTRQVVGVYAFLFQSLTRAQLQRERDGVEDVIRVLEVERETWRMVCEQLPTTPLPSAAEDRRLREISSSDAKTILTTDKPPHPEPPRPGLDLNA